MTIVSSVVKINEPNSSELDRYVRVQHTDHLGGKKTYTKDVLFNASGNVIDSHDNMIFIDLDAYVVAQAAQTENLLAEQEIRAWETELRAGGDPAHIGHDGDTWFTNSVPDFNTWEDCIAGAIIPILQETDPQQLVNIADCWGRLINKEGEDIAGKPNDVAAEIQDAVNAQVRLDNYVPLIDDEGNPRA